MNITAADEKLPPAVSIFIHSFKHDYSHNKKYVCMMCVLFCIIKTIIYITTDILKEVDEK